jgi:cytochrome c-type biogenesis protein CcmH/NrfF
MKPDDPAPLHLWFLPVFGLVAGAMAAFLVLMDAPTP